MLISSLPALDSGCLGGSSSSNKVSAFLANPVDGGESLNCLPTKSDLKRALSPSAEVIVVCYHITVLLCSCVTGPLNDGPALAKPRLLLLLLWSWHGSAT